ncbi:hypothetical protein B0H16DRAFT_1568941 [Mycena metata]|uniref:Uncharacterized protein n=1 Tax=Mycena metata TaxID=1033252 RepID=A0AAD7ICR5_9AGAR|nr:hypothetical protein B0H16DRAFT_1568941 [Mycena metata]
MMEGGASDMSRLHFMILFYYFFLTSSNACPWFFHPFIPTIHPRYAPLCIYLSILFCQLYSRLRVQCGMINIHAFGFCTRLLAFSY